MHRTPWLALVLTACSTAAAPIDAGPEDAFVARDAWRAGNDTAIPRPVDAATPCEPALRLVYPTAGGVLGPSDQRITVIGGSGPVTAEICADEGCTTPVRLVALANGRATLDPLLPAGHYAWLAHDGTSATRAQPFDVASVPSGAGAHPFDADGDGRADIVACVTSSPTASDDVLYAWLHFADPARRSTPTMLGACGLAWDLGDVDGDGASDVADFGAEVAVRHGAPCSPFAQRGPIDVGPLTLELIEPVGDVDADGYDDVATTLFDATNALCWLALLYGGTDPLGARSELLQSWACTEADLSGALAGLGADLDGDGRADLACALDGAVTFYASRPGVPPLRIVALADVPDLGAGIAAVGDVDHDGAPDLAVLQRTPPGVRFLALDGTLSDLVPVPITPSSGAWLVAASDFDRDGAGDVVVASSDAAYLVFGGSGAATLLTSEPTLGQLNVGAPGDVDGDGARDLVVGGYASGRIVLFSGGSRDVTRTIEVLAADPHHGWSYVAQR